MYVCIYIYIYIYTHLETENMVYVLEEFIVWLRIYQK